MSVLLQGSATPEGGRGQLDRDLHNARALGNALLVCMTLPWGLCCLFYIGMALATVPQNQGHLVAAPTWIQAVLKLFHQESTKPLLQRVIPLC